MPLLIVCPKCKKQLKIADTAAGKQIKCPGCAAVFLAGKPASAPATPAAPAKPKAVAPPPVVKPATVPADAEGETPPQDRNKATRRPQPQAVSKEAIADNVEQDDDEAPEERAPRAGKNKPRRASLAFRVSALILSVIGGLFSGGLGVAWMMQASSPEVKAMREFSAAIARETESKELHEKLAQLDRMVRSSYFLLLAAPLAIAGGVLAVLGRVRLGGALMLAAVPVPLFLNVLTLMPLYFLIVGGLLALLTPSWSPGGGPPTIVVALLTAGGWLAVLVGWIVMILLLPKPNPEVKTARGTAAVSPSVQGGAPLVQPSGQPGTNKQPGTDKAPAKTPSGLDAEIAAAGAGVKLVKLDLAPAGLDLTIDVPVGAKAQHSFEGVTIGRDEHFCLKIGIGKADLAEKKSDSPQKKVLVQSRDMVFLEGNFLNTSSCAFARITTLGYRDYTIENHPVVELKLVHYNKADCLLMLKCARTLALKVPPPADAVAALKQLKINVQPEEDGKLVSLFLNEEASDSTLMLVKKLPDLRELHLNGPHFHDDGLAHLAECTNLRNLELSCSALTDAGFQHLSKLTNLETLSLYSSFGSKITGSGLPQLAGLRNLHELNLGGTKIDDAGLAYLEGLTNVQSLDLYKTPITGSGLAHLQGMKSLTKLQLSATKITDANLANLRGLRNLEELNLYETPITGEGLSHLREFKGLKRLNLDKVKDLTDKGVVQIGNLVRLESLNLGNTPVRDAELAHLNNLKELTELSLPNTTISDAGLVHLRGMTKLDSLDLTKTRVTVKGVQELKKALPQATISHGLD